MQETFYDHSYEISGVQYRLFLELKKKYDFEKETITAFEGLDRGTRSAEHSSGKTNLPGATYVHDYTSNLLFAFTQTKTEPVTGWKVYSISHKGTVNAG